MPPPVQVCLQTGEKTSFGALFKGDAERSAFHAKVDKDIQDIESEGFVRDEQVPNMFTKDNVAITLEGWRHAGKDKTLAWHSAIVDKLKSRG